MAFPLKVQWELCFLFRGHQGADNTGFMVGRPCSPQGPPLVDAVSLVKLSDCSLFSSSVEWVSGSPALSFHREMFRVTWENSRESSSEVIEQCIIKSATVWEYLRWGRGPRRLSKPYSSRSHQNHMFF